MRVIARFAILFLLIAVFVSSCRFFNKEEEEDIDLVIEAIDRDTVEIFKEPGFFRIEYSDSGFHKDMLVEINPIQTNDSPEYIMEQLNFFYPSVEINKVNKVEDYIEVIIEDATALTQRMGSSGAQEYLVHAVYAFTSLENIERVKFVFEEGDHAEPGFYSRENWNYTIMKD